MADDTPTVEQATEALIDAVMSPPPYSDGLRPLIDALISAVRAEQVAPTTTVANFRRIVREYGIDQALAEVRALQEPDRS